MKIPVEISARHVHLTKEDFEKLFGKNKQLTLLKYLSQPGEFASNEKVSIISSKRKIENVRILGPFRKNSQIEISLTDAYSLKLDPLPKIRISGDVSDTIKILVKGPKGSVKIPCIIAKRHLHCNINEAKNLKLKNKQIISIKVKGKRTITFHDVPVRVSENYKLSFHLDTDEGNAAGIFNETFGEIVNEK